MKILFTSCSFSEQQIDDLAKQGITVIPVPGNLTEEQLIESLKDKDGIITGGTEKISRKVIESLPNVKYILYFGTNYQTGIDMAAAREKNIIATNNPHANAYSVAEFAAVHILNAVKQLTYLNNSTKQGKWQRLRTRNLQGMTLGIIGLGHIGGYVAKMMTKGFDMNVVYFSRTRKESIERELDIQYMDLKKLLQTADIVSLHIPFETGTENLIGEKELAFMKQGSILVNVSRAGVVDGHALYQALTNNHLSMASFDVYYQEPVPPKEKDEYQLLNLPDNKFILTPHSAYNTQESIDAMNEMTIKSLLEIKNNQRPTYAVS